MTICIVYYCHHIPSYLLYNLLFSLKRKGHLGSSEYYVLVVFFSAIYFFVFISNKLYPEAVSRFKSSTGYCNLNTQGLCCGQIKCDEYLLRWGMRVRHFKHTLSLKHTCVNISVKVKRFISAPLVASHGNAIGAFFFKETCLKQFSYSGTFFVHSCSNISHLTRLFSFLWFMDRNVFISDLCAVRYGNKTALVIMLWLLRVVRHRLVYFHKDSDQRNVK